MDNLALDVSINQHHDIMNKVIINLGINQAEVCVTDEIVIVIGIDPALKETVYNVYRHYPSTNRRQLAATYHYKHYDLFHVHYRNGTLLELMAEDVFDNGRMLIHVTTLINRMYLRKAEAEDRPCNLSTVTGAFLNHVRTNVIKHETKSEK